MLVHNAYMSEEVSFLLEAFKKFRDIGSSNLTLIEFKRFIDLIKVGTNRYQINIIILADIITNYLRNLENNE